MWGARAVGVEAPVPCRAEAGWSRAERGPGVPMPGEPVHSDDEQRTLSRRALMRLGVAGSAVVGVSAFVTRALSAEPRSPFDAPFGFEPAPRGRGSARAAARAGAPTIVDRAHWGADERIRSREIDFDDTVEKIVVHHTGTEPRDGDWPKAVRDIYRSTVRRGYRDVPYHWLIDPDGLVYEGRWARPDRAGHAPNGEDARGRSVRGGHAKAHNDRTIGVALLGNFADHRPTDAAFAALVGVVAWKCARWGIDPAGESPYRLRDGSEQVIPNICPHRRVRATACPGRAVVDLLPELRFVVAQRLAA